MKNYYKILGVPFTATLAEIKKTFRQLAVKLHPDKNPNNKVAEEEFKKVSEAYEHLSCDEKRKIHDAQLEQEDRARNVQYARAKQSDNGFAIFLGIIAFVLFAIGMVSLLSGKRKR